MIYKAIGLMSGSSLDGLDIAYTHFQQTGGKWSYEIIQADCYGYTPEWKNKLAGATALSAFDYCVLHTAFGHYLAEQVNGFIEAHSLYHQVDLIASHGHTAFHDPARRLTAQLGDGAALAAGTGLPVVSDLRAMDVALGGQGAPIVPIGEKWLLSEYNWLLNLGGIANLSANKGEEYVAFDVCPANRVLNMLAGTAGKEYDDEGRMAAAGRVHEALLQELDSLDYYSLPFPKSLANEFGTRVVYPLISKWNLSVEDALRTYVAHICTQIARSVQAVQSSGQQTGESRLLATGGGALNNFLVQELQQMLRGLDITLVIPDKNLIQYKEAVIMGLIGVLRWREEVNVLSSVTGARYSSIGGALWMGHA
ncbi:MAG: anhydro-N-acetylmuramic acid kinase [Williamsia sp.]|nr:anhydro-N-acetylmuramic acid kinase [Williamsia sp.]